MNKIVISEKDIHTLVMESVKRCLKEAYNRNEFYNYHSGISDDKEFMYLEDLVGNFGNEMIEYDSDTNKADFEDFINGLLKLKQKSLEKREFDKINIKSLYQQYVNEGNEDDFWSLDIANDCEYLDEYVGEYARTELWDRYMPAPERVDYLIDRFKQDLKLYTEFNIKSYERQMWDNYKTYMEDLERI